MAEAKAVLVGEDRARRLDELLARKRHQARSDGAAVDTAHQLADRAAPELLADDGRPLDHGALVGREAIEPCREQSVNRGRDCEVAGRRPVLGDHGEQLLDEERVALRSLGDPAQQRLFDLGLASQVAEQLLGLRCGERLEHDRLADECHAGWRSSRSGRARQRMRIGASRLQPTTYSISSTKVGSAHWRSSKPDDQRPLARDVLEQPTDGPHRLFRRGRVVADPDRRGHLARDPLSVRFPCEQLVEPARAAAPPAASRTMSRNGQYVIPSP